MREKGVCMCVCVCVCVCTHLICSKASVTITRTSELVFSPQDVYYRTVVLLSYNKIKSYHG